ncbi:MAG: hypothetical protein ACRDF9_13145 [Candidatus Limnocylindria bacterium]
MRRAGPPVKALWGVRRKSLSLITTTAMLLTCDVADAGKASDLAVQRFHELFNNGAYVVIYQEASPEFRASTPQARFVALLEAVRRKIGKVNGTERQSIHVFASTTANTAVTASYLTRFETGQAAETFRWVLTERMARLINYDINSPDLITR